MRLLEPAGEPYFTLAAIGDVGVIGSARARAAREGWDAPFAALAPAFAAADLSFANLEFPVGRRDWVKAGRADEFFHDDDIAAALVRAGVKVVSLANNHMMDCGPQGLARTLEVCRSAGLAVMGAGADLAAARAPARFTVRGTRVALLAYSQTSTDAAGAQSPGIAPLDPMMITEDVARARSQTDVVIVSVHWGSMYVDYPPPRVLDQAKAILAAGPDVVLGHHPHVLQGAERRGRTIVLYSMGDAVFNCRAGDFHAQVSAQVRLESAVFMLTLAHDAHGLDVQPLQLDDDGFPSAAAGPPADAALARWRGLSDGLADAEARFAAEGAPRLLQYELQSLGTYVRQGRWDRVVKLLGSVRPRHLPLLWTALTRGKKKAADPPARRSA